jgi:methylthioribose-1-phosphate isomerase
LVSPLPSVVRNDKARSMKQPLEWQGKGLRLLDQTQLPKSEVWVEISDYQEVVHAIKTMKVRGAPAIGVAAAYGIALGAANIKTDNPDEFKSDLEVVFHALGSTRPTARNLFSTIERMKQIISGISDVAEVKRILELEAITIHSEQMKADRSLSLLGANLIKPDSNILTHCNTGPLATGGYGTALGIIICAFEQGKIKQVFATETRPLFQGSRLTSWELKQAGIPFKLITDSMSGYVIQSHKVDAVVVGADRIARNGDTANKIGTYTLAILAMAHGIPFYVAAPTTTIDKTIATGDEIIIEQRHPNEVTCINGFQLAPDGVEVLNPSFDVTPAKYISAIITEEGIWNLMVPPKEHHGK